MSAPRDNKFDEQKLEEAQQAVVKSENMSNPCSTHWPHNFLKVFEVEKDRVKATFSKVQKISLSLDVQKRPESMEVYVCLRAHLIADNWKLRNWVIKYCRLNDANDNLPYLAMETLKEYDIEDDVLFLTMENINHQELVKSNKVMSCDSWFRLRCFCDTLTQMVQGGFHEINDIITKLQLLLSWKETLPVWYLTTYQLSSALELHSVGEFADASEVPSEEDWEKVRKVCIIANRLYEITKELYVVKMKTANLFLPYFLEVRAYLLQESENTDEFVRHLVQKMFDILHNYWNNVFLPLSIAAFLDPRYKLKLFELCIADKVNQVKMYIQKYYHIYKQYHNTSLENMPVLKKFCEAVKSQDSIKSELECYVAEPVLPWTDDFAILNWWKENQLKYPTLSKMARHFLPVPMTVATSFCDSYYTKRREPESRLVTLEPKFMNALKCSESWKKLSSKKG